MRLTDSITIGAAAVVAVACVTVGVTVTPPDENRALTAVPSLAEVAMLEVEALAQAVDAVEDRSGLRSPAVTFNRWLREDVIQERVGERHVRGDDGWLYYRPDIEGACERPPAAPVVDAMSRRLSAVGAAAGIEVVVVITPDKASIHPEHLGPFINEGECGATEARQLSELAPPVVAPYAEIRRLVTEPNAELGDPYFKQDTHWRHIAAATASRRVFELAAPELVDSLELVRTDVATRDMDLARFAGIKVSVEEPVWTVRPRGTALATRETSERWLERLTVTGTRVPDRDVLFVRDSFGESMIPSMAHLGRSLTVCACKSGFDARTGPLLDDVDLLVLQIVQRAAVLRLVTADAPGQLAASLGDRLPGTPLQLGADGSVTLPASGLVRFIVEGSPREARVLAADGELLGELSIRGGGQVGALFVEDVDARNVRIELVGAVLRGAVAVPLP